jgi:hypothetical protein
VQCVSPPQRSICGTDARAEQANEDWLTPFKSQITRDWDITAIHINKNNMAGVKADIDYYYNKYGKALWVTEFACVDGACPRVPPSLAAAK